MRWYCFYKNRDWNENVAGRRLQWSDPHCDDVMDFEQWSFANKTSSWVNTGFLEVTVWDDTVHKIWTEAPNSLSSYVGSSHNDSARFFEACACPSARGISRPLNAGETTVLFSDP
ncbi:hypothetical protein [Streptomyces doebereineriae]|uniref:hypothetical protein n=1 Tax=Streptomyces doebereineriae TaxID=3075528 RepID=UPI00374DFF9D